MGYRMRFRFTNKDEKFAEEGVLPENNWLALKALEALLDSQPEYFDNKAALTTAIPSPSDRQRAYIVGTGAVRYKASVVDWVLESDDTTVA